MRETLHQLSVALALPLAVIAVWVVRGEPAGLPAGETATAYRANLADLPLPSRERLRTPGSSIDIRAPRVTPEDASPRHRRPLLPVQSTPPPVDIAVDASSETAVDDPPSRRPEQEQPAAVPQPLVPAPQVPPALFAAAPTASLSHRPTTAPKIVAWTVPADLPVAVSAAPVKTIAGDSAAKGLAPNVDGTSTAKAFEQGTTATFAARAPAPSATGSSPASALVPTSPERSAAKKTVPAALPIASTPAWVAALGAPPGLSQRETTPASSHTPASVPDDAWEPATVSPIVMGRDELDVGQGRGFGNVNDHAPLTPPGLSNDRVILSVPSDSFGNSAHAFDLPLPALEHAAVASSVDYGAEDLPSSAQPFGLFATPTTLQVIPEPGSALLLGAALAALGAVRRRQRRA